MWKEILYCGVRRMKRNLKSEYRVHPNYNDTINQLSRLINRCHDDEKNNAALKEFMEEVRELLLKEFPSILSKLNLDGKILWGYCLDYSDLIILMKRRKIFYKKLLLLTRMRHNPF